MPDMIRRRDASYTRDDVTSSKFPIVTFDQLADAIRVQETHRAEDINQPMMSLILARKAIGDAVIACHHAARMNQTKLWVSDRLSILGKQLEVVMESFPLEIKGQPLVPVATVDSATIVEVTSTPS